MSTQSVLDRHLQAFGDGDVEASVADYAEDSIFISPRGVVLGASAMRAVYEELFSGLFQPGSYEFTMDKVTVEGDLAVIVWHATGERADVPFGDGHVRDPGRQDRPPDLRRPDRREVSREVDQQQESDRGHALGRPCSASSDRRRRQAGAREGGYATASRSSANAATRSGSWYVAWRPLGFGSIQTSAPAMGSGWRPRVARGRRKAVR